jgi:hypothetical protein
MSLYYRQLIPCYHEIQLKILVDRSNAKYTNSIKEQKYDIKQNRIKIRAMDNIKERHKLNKNTIYTEETSNVKLKN